MTIRLTIEKLTIEADDASALFSGLIDHMVAALNAATPAGRLQAAKSAPVLATGPTPPVAELGENARPYAEIIGLLRIDGRHRDVTDNLIVPLLERGLKVQGEPRATLGRTATVFQHVTQRKLETACRILLNGRHTYFPDADEIWAAIGKSGETQAQEAA